MSFFYDRIAADYAAHRKAHPKLLQTLVELCRAKSPSRVLEVGCGTGNYVTPLAALTPAHCSGLDPSLRMLDAARQRNAPVSWVQGSAESLPFPDGSCDFVYSVDVIHHVQDRGAFFSEAFRVLARGGWFVTVTISEGTVGHQALLRYFPEAIGPEVARYPKSGEIPQLLGSAGFQRFYDETIESAYLLSDPAPIERKVFSSLILIPDESFKRGLVQLRRDLQAGPIPYRSRHVIYGGCKPADRQSARREDCARHTSPS